MKRRKNLLKATKGYRWGRKSKINLARVAMLKAGVYAYRDRRAQKRIARQLWQIKINAASRANGLSYSKLSGALRKAKIDLDRKILADLAENHPAIFAKVVEAVK